MEKRRLSQEGLKILACAAMLLDHLGASILPWIGLRIVGRLAFPIFCFLLAEGVVYTKSPLRYGMRLFVCMLLSEFPFDLFSSGRFSWAGQSTMATLFLSFLLCRCMQRTPSLLVRLLWILPFSLAAELLRTDYGGFGVMMAALFFLSRDLPMRTALQAVGLLCLCWCLGGIPVSLGTFTIPIELFALAALLPISCYSGEKKCHSRTLQWGFYLFYPAHLAVLAIIFR